MPNPSEVAPSAEPNIAPLDHKAWQVDMMRMSSCFSSAVAAVFIETLVDEKVVPMMNKTKATNPTWGIKKGSTKKIAPSVRAIKIILTVPKRCKIPTDKGFISVTPAGRERSNKPNWASSSSNFCLR